MTVQGDILSKRDEGVWGCRWHRHDLTEKQLTESLNRQPYDKHHRRKLQSIILSLCDIQQYY